MTAGRKEDNNTPMKRSEEKEHRKEGGREGGREKEEPDSCQREATHFPNKTFIGCVAATVS